MCEHHCVHCAQQCAAMLRLVVCGSACEVVRQCAAVRQQCVVVYVRQCERQCAVVRTARTARGTARQCAAVAIIVVILQPPCFATNCCYNDTAAPVLRNNYYYNARVIYGSAGGLRTGHLRTAGGLRIYGWVSGGLLVIPAAAMEYQLGS